MASTHDEGDADSIRRYDVVVRGTIDATLAAQFTCATLIADEDLTQIDVTVADQAELVAILQQLFAAGIELVSLNQRDAAGEPASTG
jgi:hypothetical protein